MKKVIAISMILLTIVSTFAILAPHLKAESALDIEAIIESNKEVWKGRYSRWEIGDWTYLITAIVTSDGLPVSGASVTAEVTGPSGEQYWLRDGSQMLYDTVQGKGIDETGTWKLGPVYGGVDDDGIYANFLALRDFWFANHAGTWRITLTASKEGYVPASTELTIDVVRPTGNFGHRFNFVDLDTSTPEENWVIYASPGQTLNAKLIYDETNPCAACCVFYIRAWGCPYEEWGTAYNIDRGCTGWRSNVERSWTYTVPSTPGIYTLTLNEQFAYWWPFYGEFVGFVGKVIVGAPPPPRSLDPWEYSPYVYLDYGYGFPWDTTPDLPVNVLYTGTYFWGDLRVIQYWLHWNVDYMWWLAGFINAAYKYTIGEGWTNPLRQAAKQHDWEPVFIIVNDQGSIDSVLVRWHYEWIKYDLTVAGADLLHPTYQDTHIKLWFSIGSHTPLTWHFAFTTTVLLKIGGLIAPPPFNTLLGLAGTYAQPPLYSFQDQGITYPSGMESWNEDLALSLGFASADLKYVNNPTLAYSELLLPPILSVVAESPVNILVTAPNGLRVGYDLVTEFNEIEGATYSGLGTEPQVVNIPSPLPGVYNIDIFGTGSGAYAITIRSVAEDGSVVGTETYTGETVEGAVYVYTVSIIDEVMTTSPDPIAELEHFKDVIDGLPDDSFDKPKLASQRKNALFNKIDEVILKVEAGNYTDAINKLLHDIRAKMDGDPTPNDWIIELTTELCIIIDHIISSIETL